MKLALTEHEKLLAGQDYDYRDPELQHLLARGRQLVTQINTLSGETREAAIWSFLATVGQRLTINGHFEAIYGVHIAVGDDVWIGGNVTVIGGVHIGNNVVIAAGAVVVNDIPDNCVAGGVPAKVIKPLPALD